MSAEGFQKPEPSSVAHGAGIGTEGRSVRPDQTAGDTDGDRDELIESYKELRKAVARTLRWATEQTSLEELGTLPRRLLAGKISLGLCAPMFAEISMDADSWLWQRTTRGNKYGELDDLDVLGARVEAEELLTSVLVAMTANCLVASSNPTESLRLSLKALEVITMGVCMVATAGKVFVVCDSHLIDAAGIDDLALVAEKVAHRFQDVLVEAGV